MEMPEEKSVRHTYIHKKSIEKIHRPLHTYINLRSTYIHTYIPSPLDSKRSARIA